MPFEPNGHGSTETMRLLSPLHETKKPSIPSGTPLLQSSTKGPLNGASLGPGVVFSRFSVASIPDKVSALSIYEPYGGSFCEQGCLSWCIAVLATTEAGAMLGRLERLESKSG